MWLFDCVQTEPSTILNREQSLNVEVIFDTINAPASVYQNKDERVKQNLRGAVIMILIICALKLEAKPFLDALEHIKVEKIGDLKVYQGEICGARVIISKCGVGVLKSAETARLLIDKYDISHIIMSGTAGGIDRTLRIGDTVVSEDILFHDDSYKIFSRDGHAGMNTTYTVNPALLDNIKKAISEDAPTHPVYYGRITTGRKFVAQKDFDSITGKYDPLCSDMESASVANVACEFDIPFFAVRSISDNAGNPGIGTFLKNASFASLHSFNVASRTLKMLEKT